jgi:ornithine cyclodeaminase/alanine dehydrogenase-like protein (mu-crystallin family)
MPVAAAAPALAQTELRRPAACAAAVIGCGGMGRNDLADFQRQADAPKYRGLRRLPTQCRAGAPSDRRTGGDLRLPSRYRAQDVDAVVIAHARPLYA